MYVKHLTCEQYGPIKQLALNFPFDEQGSPKVVNLVGQNGAGKSIVLSALLDAFVEVKRIAYAKVPEVPEGQMLRFLKKDYIHREESYSYICVEITHDAHTAKATEVCTRIPYTEFQEKYPADKYPHLNIQEENFKKNGFFKRCAAPAELAEAAKQSVLLYLPYFRYESPAWLNPSANVGMETRTALLGQSENIIKTNIVREIESWMLDVTLDKELYEKQIVSNIQSAPALPPGIGMFLGYSGPNTTTQALLNELLTAIYKAKDPEVQMARFGVSGKASRRISIIVKRADGVEESVAPTLSHLSSGEFMAFSIGAAILREYDQLRGGPASTLSEISGVVMIDEIDLHLHIKMQKEVLPTLISKFPKIQFIVSTHSPFFLLGLKEMGQIGSVIYQLPQGNQIDAENFVEFEADYDTFVARDKQYKSAYDEVVARINCIARPLLLTEGKTDWKHLKSALKRLNPNVAQKSDPKLLA